MKRVLDLQKFALSKGAVSVLEANSAGGDSNASNASLIACGPNSTGSLLACAPH